jgi:VWFA-related protein
VRATIAGASLALLAATAAASAQEQALPQAPQFSERVEVARVLMDLRIVDDKGGPLPALGKDDLRVSVDGQPAVIESLKWISGETPYAEGLTPELAAATGGPAAPAGRLLVFFFQKDLTQASRISGLMHMKERAAKLLQTLKPEDRVAVFSFDTHLELWSDFTTDRGRIRQIVERSILLERPPAEVSGSYPSLAENYDRKAAAAAASPEAAFAVLGRALAPLPGVKSLAFFGWGLGRLNGDSVEPLPEYPAARRALREARVVVFSLDITDADSHSLEAGLEQLADDTGGFYVKTHLFPALAMDRLERALLGYYALAFEKPLLPPGRHDVKVEVIGRKGTVLTTATYVD